jgi:hypothetical protein
MPAHHLDWHDRSRRAGICAWLMFARIRGRGSRWRRVRMAAASSSRSLHSTHPAGAAVVNAIGPIRQIVKDDTNASRRHLVIAAGTATAPGAVVQVQSP